MLDIDKCIRKKRVLLKNGKGYTAYYFNCLRCRVEICTQHGYAKRHSGLCRSCSQLGLPLQSSYNQLVTGSRSRGIDVKLTYEEFLLLARGLNCHYCDQKINRTTKRGEPGYRGYFLDRKDNDLGYSLNNCVPCCWACNQAKGNRYTYEEFLTISEILKTHRKRNVIDFGARF